MSAQTSLAGFISGLLGVARKVPPGLRDPMLHVLAKSARVPAELQRPLVELVGGLVDGNLAPEDAAARAQKFATEMHFKSRFM